MVEFNGGRHGTPTALHRKSPAVRGCLFCYFQRVASHCASPCAPPPSTRTMHRSPDG